MTDDWRPDDVAPCPSCPRLCVIDHDDLCEHDNPVCVERCCAIEHGGVA